MTLKPSPAGGPESWTKSSYSASDSNECVEVAAAVSVVRVRDSKDPQGPQLALSPAAWASFVSHTAAR